MVISDSYGITATKRNYLKNILKRNRCKSNILLHNILLSSLCVWFSKIQLKNHEFNLFLHSEKQKNDGDVKPFKGEID